jgi:hypothetical protein
MLLLPGFPFWQSQFRDVDLAPSSIIRVKTYSDHHTYLLTVVATSARSTLVALVNPREGWEDLVVSPDGTLLVTVSGGYCTEEDFSYLSFNVYRQEIYGEDADLPAVCPAAYPDDSFEIYLGSGSYYHAASLKICHHSDVLLAAAVDYYGRSSVFGFSLSDLVSAIGTDLMPPFLYQLQFGGCEIDSRISASFGRFAMSNCVCDVSSGEFLWDASPQPPVPWRGEVSCRMGDTATLRRSGCCQYALYD